MGFAFLMSVFPMWFSLFSFVLIFSIFMVGVGDYFPSNERPNKFWMGTFVFGYWFNVLVYFVYVSDYILFLFILFPPLFSVFLLYFSLIPDSTALEQLSE